MRFRKRWFVIALILLAIFLPGKERWRKLVAWLQPSQLLEKSQEDVIASSGYVISRGAWVTLDLPEKCPAIRLLTNATIEARLLHQQIERELEQSYCLAYDFRDHRGESLGKGEYQFRTKANAHRISATGQIRTSPFFPPGDERFPAATQTWILPDDSIPHDAKHLRIQLKSCSSHVSDVVVRSYVRMPGTSEYGSRPMWDRLPPGRRHRLASAYVFPADALTSTQIQNLIENDWSSLLPVGIQSVDYESRTLYSMQGHAGDSVGPTEFPTGLPVGEHLRAVIPLPAIVGDVELRFQPQGTFRPHEVVTVVCRAFHGSMQPPESFEFSVSDKSQTIRIRTTARFLELESSRAGALRAYWIPEGINEVAELDSTTSGEQTKDEIIRKGGEITPEPAFQLAYRLEGTTAADYEISHLAGAPTPIRIAVRTESQNAAVANSRDESGILGGEQQLSKKTLAATSSLEWALFDKGGEVLRTGQLNVAPELSNYDRVDDWKKIVRVSEPQYFFLQAEPKAVRLRVKAREDVSLVSVFCRSPDLPQKTSVPHDYLAFHRNLTESKMWFFIRCLDHEELCGERATVDLKLQSRPPEQNQELQQGRFQWEDFDPQGNWLARRLVVPRDDRIPARAAAVATTYRELNPGQEYELKLIAADGTTDRIAPRIIFRTETNPQMMRITINDQLHDQLRLHSPVGECKIAPIDARQPIRLRIEADASTRIYMNHLRSDDHPQFQSRMANRFRNGQLEFAYDKRTHEREMLLLRYFESVESDENTRLQVTISAIASDLGNASDLVESGSGAPNQESPEAFGLRESTRREGPNSEWTSLYRIFDLERLKTRVGIVVGEATERVDPGQLIFLPLGSDLPIGTYRIDVRLLNRRQGYLMLYRTQPGEAAAENSISIDR